MCISSIAGTALGSLLNVAPNSKSAHGNFQQIQSEFQEPGKDLQAGNLTQAQQDYATLSHNFSNAQTSTAAATANNSNPVAQAFTALSQDLQNGNISGAQKDYANIQQDFQQQHGTSQVHHRHHHGAGGQQSNEISQALNSLSAALQSNNLSSAQTAFATLQQDLLQSTELGASTQPAATRHPTHKCQAAR